MSSPSLSRFGGEFLAPDREAAFQSEHLSETVRQVRLLFLLSAIVNTVLFVGDWRFFGTPHFSVAVPARIVAVAAAVACLRAIRRADTFRRAQATMVAWQWITAAAAACIANSHTDLALFAVLLLPSIYYLAVPTRFRWTVASGAACSLLMLAGYLYPDAPRATATGLVPAVAMLNVALVLVVAHGNRLQRTEWAASDAERQAREALVESRTMFETMFKTVPIPLVVVRMDGLIVDTNAAANRYLGASRETLGIQSVDELYVNPGDRTAFLAALRRGGHVQDFETKIRLADGSIRTVLLAGKLLDIGGAPHVMAAVVDITERKAAEERSWRAASHDPLTDLPNRALFQSRLEQALAQAERNGSRVSLLLVDLDNLKAVNDMLGHDAGDAFLKETADRLRVFVRDCDTVARLGGDEFVLIVMEPLSLGSPMALADEILADLRRPFAYGSEVLSGHVSIGIASYPDHDSKPSDLLKDADLALYAAKAQGRDCAVIYTSAMRRNIERKALAARSIQQAVRLGQIVPFYQPKVDLATGSVTGFEALARWHHPEQGLLTPAAFASAFDDPELSVALGESMIRQVAADIRSWLDRGIDCGRVAVNLSSAQFNWIGLARRFLDVLRAAGIPNDRLEVEITETVFLGRSSAHVGKALKQFHDSGIRIALDDFGTGYASLTHLKQFPIDDIKIDQSFVRDLQRDPGNAAIIFAVIELGASLGMDVIAEGVETAEQARFLMAKGCSKAQGNFYAPPMAAREVPQFLKRHALTSASSTGPGRQFRDQPDAVSLGVSASSRDLREPTI